MGRILATRYDEVVVDRRFEVKTQLTKALQPLVDSEEMTLQLDTKQAGTIVRVDTGGGNLDDIN